LDKTPDFRLFFQVIQPIIKAFFNLTLFILN